jgi:PncC family amidohydrolase
MLKKIIRQIHQQLTSQKKTISVAESCTGGQLSNALTCLPGSSGYFLLGVISYSNKSKETILGIPAKIISRYGAVSRQVTILMAQNIRKKARTDLSLSITGIAGPSGATTSKAVGTVYICLGKKNQAVVCRKLNLQGSRKNIRKKSTYEALRLLCAHLSR